MVTIKPKFTKAQIEKVLRERVGRIDAGVKLILERVGEQFIIDARSTDTYKDQTGNLRSSIGYVILKNGEQITDGFPGSTNEGRSTAKEVISDISEKFTKGYVLIVVAGMDYAAAVESKGFDVLTGSSPIAVANLKKYMASLNSKVSRL